MQEFIVSTLEDENDGNFDAGDLSLREAIAQTESGDTITFDSNLSGGTINLSLGELLIDRSLTIQELGADQLTIDANSRSRIFNVDDSDDDFLATVSISGLTITNGVTGADRNGLAENGAGILNQENLTVNNSVVTGNRIQVGGGGGIANEGELVLNNSLVSNNRIGFRGALGGGILNRGMLNVINSTIADNSSVGQGGGIYNTGTLNVTNSTITDNGSASSSGDAIDSTGSATITSSIIADNDNGNFRGIFTSGGNNLIGNIDNPGLIRSGFVSEDSDIVGTFDNPIDPLLGELQDNGGATPTFALLENSPAIDAGSNPNNLATDQRGEGFDRTVGGGTDIGAFELQTINNEDDGDSEPPNNGDDGGDGDMIPDELVVSTLEDENDGDFGDGDLSLREAISIANDTEGEDTITFDSSLSGGTITLIRDQSTGRPTLANAPLSITDSVTISGLGKDNITIDGDNGANGIFLLGSDGQQINVTVEDLTLANGAQSAFFFPGLSAPGGTFDVGANTNFTLQNSLITSSSASIGGAINNNGTVSIINSTIQDSASGSDGPTSNPIGRNGVVVNNGEMDIISSDISNNSTGGLTNLGILRVTDSTIANNNFNTFNSNTFGGGIDNRSVLTVSNSTIAGNTATLGGGIFSSQDAQTTVNNSTITDNSAAEGGNGVYNQQGSNEGTFNVASTIIAGNADNLDLGGDAFFDSQGNNLIGNAEGVNSSFEQSNNDLVGTSDNPIDPLLGELQDNGGATPTIALLEDSPAIDAGSNPNGLTTDQRGEGFDRTVGNGTDIGAFELQAVVTPNVNEIIGTAGGDVLDGTESGDRILGLDGNDTIRGLGGDDTIEGNNGNDSLEGGADNDFLDGFEGFDSLFGGEGNDTLNGGNGNDSIDGGAGNDLLIGDGDRDTLLGGDGEDTLEGGTGVDFLDGGANNDQLFGGLDNDSLRGGAGDDLLDGGAGIDSLEGGRGNDTLLGLDGNDSLFGGNGDDFIDGGLGNDSLRGDDGNDTFVLAAGNGTDTIVDFNRGNNLLGLSSGISFADLSFLGNDIILGDETLATLNGFDAASLTESNFINI